MNYKLIKDISDTWFYEFFPGKYKGRYNTESVYINMKAMALISDCLHIANNNFSDEITVYTKEKGQIKLLWAQLLFRLTQIVVEKDFSDKFNPEIISDLKNNKQEIINMIQDLIYWIEILKEDELTVIGTKDKFADLILNNPKDIKNNMLCKLLGKLWRIMKSKKI